MMFFLTRIVFNKAHLPSKLGDHFLNALLAWVVSFWYVVHYDNFAHLSSSSSSSSPSSSLRALN